MFIFLMLIVCGLDVGRLHISSTGMEFLAVGVIFFVIGWVFVMWSMIENEFLKLQFASKRREIRGLLSQDLMPLFGILAMPE